MRISRLVSGVLIVLLAAQAYASRGVLTPDGVSYLDLAQAVRDGEWRRFVNGYWSPLYPLLMSAVARLVPGRFDLLLAVHLLNATALAAAVAVITWSVRAARPLELRWLAPLCAGGLMVTFDVVSACTPDALLTLLAALVAVQLARYPEAWLGRGALYGLMYLAKTSTLPWLATMCALELWHAQRRGALRKGWRLLIPVAGAVLAWLGALSSIEGHPTLGSTARLNWEWYGWGIRSRFPDTDPAGHRAYTYRALEGVTTLAGATAPLGATSSAVAPPAGVTQSVRLADFGSTGTTYLPWGDPAGWSHGRVPLDAGPASPVLLAIERAAGNLWMNGVDVLGWTYVTLLLLACWWPRRGAKARRWEWATPGTLLAGSGLAGLVIMCLVHVEPRLVLPWLVLMVLGLMRIYEPPSPEKGTVRDWRWPAWLRALAIAAVAISISATSATAIRKNRLESQRAIQREASRGVDGAAASRADSSVVLVGPATSLIPELWLHGRRVLAQLVDPSFGGRPDAERSAILGLLMQRYHGRAGSMWVVTRRSAGVERRGTGPDITNYIDVVNVVKIE